MLTRLKDAILDLDTAKVFGVTIFSSGITLAQINTVINTVVLIGSAIYIWRKVLKSKKKKDDEDTET